MEERFRSKSIRNILNQLSKDDALRVVALSLAANDLNINVEALGKFPESESGFFFVTSLSILRELAKLVAGIDEASFQGRMSGETIALLGEVKASLASFEAGSLVKETLKPIRDVTFHYNHLNQKGEVGKLIDQALSEVMEKDTLKLGFSDDVNSAMGQRYFFAERFRSSILSQLLSSERVSIISVVSVNIVSLVDSLLSDLKKNHEL
jgi:hypothetical protein